jgi:hypothetical protein
VKGTVLPGGGVALIAASKVDAVYVLGAAAGAAGIGHTFFIAELARPANVQSPVLPLALAWLVSPTRTPGEFRVALAVGWGEELVIYKLKHTPDFHSPELAAPAGVSLVMRPTSGIDGAEVRPSRTARAQHLTRAQVSSRALAPKWFSLLPALALSVAVPASVGQLTTLHWAPSGDARQRFLLLATNAQNAHGVLSCTLSPHRLPSIPTRDIPRDRSTVRAGHGRPVLAVRARRAAARRAPAHAAGRDRRRAACDGRVPRAAVPVSETWLRPLPFPSGVCASDLEHRCRLLPRRLRYRVYASCLSAELAARDATGRDAPIARAVLLLSRDYVSDGGCVRRRCLSTSTSRRSLTAPAAAV